MSFPILICDDSKFARNQMARSLPAGWDVEISYAQNGQQALEQIRAGKADVMFLDLNMPVMDGYQTMQAIREQDLPTMVIVVSGDVQAQARERMLKLGALDFIRKPVDNAKLVEILSKYGIYHGPAASRTEDKPTSGPSDKLDAYREITNVAMGRAGEQLAALLDVFIKLPIPNVNLIESSELRMAIAEVHKNDYISAVSQGFVSAGINGEALVMFNESNANDLIRLLNYPARGETESMALEALMDVSNIITGACLNAIAEQLHIEFTRGQPVVLGRACGLEQLLEDNVSRWNQVVAIEVAYDIEPHDIQLDLLLLFPNSAMEAVYEKLMSIR